MSRVFALTVFAFLLAFGAGAAVTTNLTANYADQGWRSNGTSNWVGGATERIGSHTAGVGTGLVIPFWIPNLNGSQVVDAELSVTIATNTGLPYATGAANADVYAVRSAAASNTVSSDYSGGTLVVDNWFNIKSNLTLGVKTTTSTALASWIDGQVGTNGGKFVFITVRPDAIDLTYRYATVNTANSAAGRPVLKLTLKESLALATNELAVDASSPVNGPGTNWATAYQTITGAIASSSFNATNRNVILIREGTYREKINIGKSGVAGRPLVLAQATTNDRVVISGMKCLTNWTLVAGTIYSSTEMGTTYVSAVYANNIKLPKSREPSSGWWASTSASAAPSGSISTVTLTDTNHLIGLTNDLTGATVEVWNRMNNMFMEVPIISFNSTLGQVVFQGAASAWTDLSKGLYFGLMNQKSMSDLPGEWSVTTGAVNTIYLKSVDGNAPTGIEAPYLPGTLVKAQNQSHLRFDGLEFSGAGYEWVAGKGYVNWNSHNLYILNGEDIGIYNCIFYGAANLGMELRGIKDLDVAGCISRKNWFGMDLNTCTNAMVRNCDIGYNKEDSLRMFGPNNSCQIQSNYIHHTTLWGHSDTIQIAGTDGVPSTYPMYINIMNNVVLGAGQSTMTSGTMGDIFSDNMYVGCEAIMLILGHSTSGYHDILRNTFAFSRYSNLSLTWRDYNVKSNIFCTGNGMELYSIVSCTNYTGNFNWFYPAPRETNQTLLSATNYTTGKNEYYKTLAAFQAATGQDLNSNSGNPGFSNAPVAIISLDLTKMDQMTTNTFVLMNSPKVGVGDKVEYDFDGVLRTVTSMPTSNSIVVSPAVPERPARDHVFLVWGSNTNLTLDLRSPRAAGSKIYIPAYQAGDFDNNGTRDLPPMPSFLN